MDIEDQTISSVEETSEETPELQDPVFEEEETESLQPDEVNTIFLTNFPMLPTSTCRKIFSSLSNLIVILSLHESVAPDGVEGYGRVGYGRVGYGRVTALAEFLL